MAVQPIPLAPADTSANTGDNPAPPPRSRMSTRNRILFFVTAWLVVLMPFLFWWSTWFGRALTTKQLGEYLNDNRHPRHIQHAIVQLGQRISRHDPSATRWYPDLVRLASNPREEVRSTDAWVMGQDTAGPGFHDALLKKFDDPSLIGRGKAGLCFGQLRRQRGETTDSFFIAAGHDHHSHRRPGHGYRGGRYGDPPGWTHRETAAGRRRRPADPRAAFADYWPRAHTFDGDRRQCSSRNCDCDRRTRGRTSLGSPSRLISDWPTGRPARDPSLPKRVARSSGAAASASA